MKPTCWKCGGPVSGNGAECAICLGETLAFETPKRTTIDWDKVQTWQDMKAVMSGLQIWVDVNSEAHRKLAKWCVDPPTA